MNEPAKKGLPRIHLIVSAGTLPSVGKNRMDLLRYRESGIPRLTGEQLLEPLPEVASIARVTVEAGPPPDNASYDAISREFRERSGLTRIVIRSFNIHEVQIVCSAADAILAVQIGHLDVVAMGTFLA